MHTYISETEYATRGLFSLLSNEESRLADLERRSAAANRDLQHARAILHIGAPPSAFGEDTTPYFEKRARDARSRIKELEPDISLLRSAVAAKAFSVRALAGAILQIAKQGIVVVHGSLAACPSGRSVGRESLKNVIWQGRNQAMHWEEGSFNAQVVACFQRLEQDFGPQFQLQVPPSNLAKFVLDVLGWKGWDEYAKDLESLLG
jgi:hypothetical protein